MPVRCNFALNKRFRILGLGFMCLSPGGHSEAANGESPSWLSLETLKAIGWEPTLVLASGQTPLRLCTLCMCVFGI